MLGDSCVGILLFIKKTCEISPGATPKLIGAIVLAAMAATVYTIPILAGWKILQNYSVHHGGKSFLFPPFLMPSN